MSAGLPSLTVRYAQQPVCCLLTIPYFTHGAQGEDLNWAEARDQR